MGSTCPATPARPHWNRARPSDAVFRRLHSGRLAHPLSVLHPALRSLRLAGLGARTDPPQGRSGPGERGALAALAAVIFLSAPIGGRPLHAKSNLRGVAEKVSSRLHPGDIVISPVAEVPLLAHYPPKGLHFATPSGPVADAYTADWRDLTVRLRRSDPGLETRRAIDIMPPGGTCWSCVRPPSNPLPTTRSSSV